jgi:PAS domain S-box-containing protein
LIWVWLIQTLNQNSIVVETTVLEPSTKKRAIRVLYVDDDSCSQEITKQIMNDIDSSFEFDNACCVKEAFKKLATENFDVIVSDYEMPQKNGLQFLKELREQNIQIPFILFTGKSREEVAIKALNLGADGYHNKQDPPEIVYRELSHSISVLFDRDTAKHAFEESEKRYRVLMEKASETIFVHNIEGQIVDANQQAYKKLGYTKEELSKMTIADIDGEAIHTGKGDRLWPIVISGETMTFESSYKRKDGSVFPIEVSLGPIAIKNETFVMALAKDITERKEAEERRKVLERKLKDYSEHLKWLVDLRTAQLKDANERLIKSERLAAIGELAGMVGHDLRNPLAGIKNAVYFLKKKGSTISEAQSKEMLEIIDKAIDRSDKIINDLLDYAREMHLEFTKYAACTLVDEAVRMIQVPDRIQIVNYVDEDAWIWVNFDKMMRVFMNLIKNAIDAMPQNGTLKISSCKTKNHIEIAFADTGMGIPSETLSKIFTPLFTTKAQGMGFGLAICKRIIEAHGGKITVKTVLNKGTTFTITLPLDPQAPIKSNNPVDKQILGD